MEIFKDRSAIAKSMRTVGLSQSDADVYVVHAKPAAFLNSTVKADDQIELGASKLSGNPDLATGQSWPLRPVYENVEDRVKELEKMIAKAKIGVFSSISETADEQISAESTARIETLKTPFPLFFLGQVNFATATRLNPPLDQDLPNSGVLSVFYDVLEMPWGYDPADGAGFKLVWSDSDKGLERQSPPSALNNFIDADYQRQVDLAAKAAELAKQRSKVGFIAKLFGAEEEEPPFIPTPSRLEAASRELIPEGGYTLPDFWDVLPRLEPTLIGDNGVLWEEWWDYAAGATADVQIGGWAANIQSADMGLEAQLASNGVYVGDASRYESEEGRELAEGAADWMMLMQIDSADGGWVWGDGGMLYVWIRREDLARRDFDKAWCILQTS